MNIIAFILVISPILDPYILFSIGSNEIKVIDLLVIVVAIIVLFTEKKIKINRPLLTILIVILVLNFISFLGGDINRDFILSIKIIAIWMLYVILVSIMWQVYNKEKFIKYAEKIGIVVSVFLIIQFLALNLGFITFWDGKISFLQLSKYNGWAGMIDITGVIRVHSFFQEPSYVAMYLLPIIAYSIKTGKFKKSMLYMVAVILSTSSIAIIGIIVILLYFIISSEILLLNIKRMGTLFSLFFVVLMVIVGAYIFNDPVKEIIDYSIKKISLFQTDLQDERMGSTKIRVLGNIEFFKTYPTLFQLYGLGINQYPIYFPGLIAYSSTLVTFILNYGVIGVTALILYFSKLLFILKKFNKIYAILFIMYCVVDLFWFNWYFFYVLTWINVNLSRENTSIKLTRNFKIK